MSKYSLINLSSPSVQKFGSLRAIKAAFQNSVSAYDDVAVLDHNGDHYVSRISGKVRPGQHYRKFTQRGVSVTPKVVRQPATPAPALPTTREEYKAAQAKWLKDSGIKIGDTVKVTRQVESYANGWYDSWASSMNGTVGNTYEVEKDEGVGGVRLRIGCLTTFRYPFFVLEKVS